MVKEYYDICKFGCLSIKSTPFHVLQGLAIIMIIEGELKFTTVGTTTMLTEGQIEIINVKEPVKLEAVADECRLWFLYFERIFVDSIRDDFEYVLYNCNEGNFFGVKASKEQIDLLKRKFLAMLTAGEEGENSITIEKMARDILEFIWPNFNVVEYMFADKTESGERFKDISIYMFKNIEKKFSLGNIAQNVYLSAPYLSREFSLNLKKTCSEIINYYRTINVVIQLIDTDKTLSYIAETSGFSSTTYYNKVFLKFLGCSPSKFRAANKNQRFHYVVEPLKLQELENVLSYMRQKEIAGRNVTIAYSADRETFEEQLVNDGEEQREYTIKVTLNPGESLRIVKKI